MAKLFSIKQCLTGNLAEEVVTISGWVKTRRDSKLGLSFLTVHDGSCFAPLQVVITDKLANYKDDVLKLTAGCALSVTGKLITSEGKGQAIEMQAQALEVIGWVENPENYPIQAKRHTLEYLREVAHLRPRTNTISALTRIRHALAHGIHEFFYKNGFYWIPTPIITASDCEGAGAMFRVSTLDLLHLPKTTKDEIDFSKDFFGREAFLTVSGQLNAEAYCLAMSKVYTFGPTFRAENSNTSRHLAEFWMLEPEIAFANLANLCDLSKMLLSFLCKTLLNESEDDLNFFEKFIDKECKKRLESLAKADFEIMSYTDAVNALSKAKEAFVFPIQWGLDLQSEHERYLAENICKKPVFILDYPKEIKGFYMRLNDDERTVAAMDLLVPGIGELIGGSQREERLNILEKRMQECNLSQDNYQWYKDLRRYGSVPHAGFGLGFERLLSYVTGLSNVRDVIPFPRTPGHVDN